RWWRRLRGLRLLTLSGAFDPAAVALLDDRHEEVRAAAAAWATAHGDDAIVERLVAMIDDERPLCRFAAKSALLQLGRPAVAPLVARLGGAPRGRVEDV